MPKIKSVLVLQYFIKTILSAFVMGLLYIEIIKSGIIDFLLDVVWMRPAMILSLAVIPIIFANDEYYSNKKMIKMLLK